MSLSAFCKPINILCHSDWSAISHIHVTPVQVVSNTLELIYSSVYTNSHYIDMCHIAKTICLRIAYIKSMYS